MCHFWAEAVKKQGWLSSLFLMKSKKSRGRLVRSSNGDPYKGSIRAGWQGQPDGVRRLATCKGWSKQANILRIMQPCFSLTGGRYPYEKGKARMNLMVLNLWYQIGTISVNAWHGLQHIEIEIHIDVRSVYREGLGAATPQSKKHT